jgi:hypothetical protein
VGELVNFVNSLAEDPDKEFLFDTEPVAVMTKDNISEENQRLILEGTAKRIKEKLEGELEGDENAVVFIIIMLPKC